MIPKQRRRSVIKIGITIKMAILAWLLALLTLLVFVLLTIPQQKKTFLDNLQAQAHSVAVSLHNVAAGAAVNEDFVNVISAGQTLLKGDPELTFLVLTRNDGFSLLSQQSGWHLDTKLDSYWRPEERSPRGAIATVPIFEERVYHYAQPFDYSGLKWGWIHVGLSLDGYDRNIATLYRNTLLLAMACIGFSLLASMIFVRHLVRPILSLRRVVQQIADGDLSVRAAVERNDEVGHLADSVNSMVENLLHRDRILESVRFAAQHFMQESRWEDAIHAVLGKIGTATESCRACMFLNSVAEPDLPQIYEWTSPQLSALFSGPDSIAVGTELLRELLGNNQLINGPLSDLDTAIPACFEQRNILSLFLIPISAGGQMLGFLGLTDCVSRRRWTDAEQDSMVACAEIIGATIIRQRDRLALVEGKNTLEQRVEIRTRELREQMAAREQAMTELAAAQSSLLEMSRAAGMAEVATGVLHNVGNVLNSVNVSSNLLMDQLLRSRVVNVGKVADLLQQHRDDLPHFLMESSQGQQIPAYLLSLAPALEEERQLLLQETTTLREQIDHIKEIVSMQQSYGRVSGVNEKIAPQELMEDALRLNAGALSRHHITVNKDYRPLPSVTTDKHRVLQVLLNLIYNAKYACTQSTSEPKIITLRLFSEGDHICFEVKDNGIGISTENLTRIFQHGFTTRRGGHGFGLHSSALSAKELGGTLLTHSDGPGCGATFTLRLPCPQGENHDPSL